MTPASFEAQPGDVLLGYASAIRSRGKPVWLPLADRFAHLYVLGRTGVGKSYFMERLMLQDLAADQGLLVLDPHGDTVRTLERVDTTRRLHVYRADQANWQFDPLPAFEGVPIDLTVASVLSVFEKLWQDSWGPRLEHLLRSILYVMAYQLDFKLSNVNRLITDQDYRRGIVKQVPDQLVRSYWFDEFAGYSPAFRAVVTAPLQNKLGALLTDRRLRSILDTRSSSISFDHAMQQRQAIAIDLAKGVMGEGPANLLGGLIASTVVLAGLSRGRLAEEERHPYFTYLDEYPGYATALLATGLSELRKYRVGMILAHQYLAQVSPFVRDAVLGNAGSMVCFRLGAPDARVLAAEFAPRFDPVDLLNQANRNAVARLLVGGQVKGAFSVTTNSVTKTE